MILGMVSKMVTFCTCILYRGHTVALTYCAYHYHEEACTGLFIHVHVGIKNVPKEMAKMSQGKVKDKERCGSQSWWTNVLNFTVI